MKIVSESNPSSLEYAIAALKSGGVISFACDTVYGLACEASNPKALKQIYQIKGRQKNKPIAIFLPNIQRAKKLFYFDEIADKIAQKFLPGSLTMVLPIQESIKTLAQNLSQTSDEFLGFRIVDHDFIQKLLEKFDGILAVTSANISGQNPAINAKEVEKYFANSNIDILIDGGTTRQQIASTVIKIAQKKVTILREGELANEILNFINNGSPTTS